MLDIASSLRVLLQMGEALLSGPVVCLLYTISLLLQTAFTFLLLLARLATAKFKSKFFCARFTKESILGYFLFLKTCSSRFYDPFLSEKSSLSVLGVMGLSLGFVVSLRERTSWCKDFCFELFENRDSEVAMGRLVRCSCKTKSD